MANSKIVKSDDAPEGALSISIGNETFKVDDGKPYETDDIALLDTASTHEWLTIEYEDGETLKEKAKQELKDQKDLAKAKAAAEKKNATKDPLEPAVEVPETIEDVRASEGDKN